MSDRKIITTFVYPPIPSRDCDWQAHYDGDEPDDNGRMLVGRGATEAEAIQDLKDNAEDRPTPDAGSPHPSSTGVR